MLALTCITNANIPTCTFEPLLGLKRLFFPQVLTGKINELPLPS
jgi:hypothetical protein